MYVTYFCFHKQMKVNSVIGQLCEPDTFVNVSDVSL